MNSLQNIIELHGESYIKPFLMGPLMVLGAYFVQTGRLELLPFLVSLPLGLFVGSVTLSNNLRDILYDRKAEVITLPMQIGIKSAKILYYAMILVPYFLLGFTVALKLTLYPTLLAVLSIPMAFKAINAMRGTEDTAEDISAKAPQLKYPLNSIRLHTQFSVLLLIGLILAALIH